MSNKHQMMIKWRYLFRSTATKETFKIETVGGEKERERGGGKERERGGGEGKGRERG